MAKVVRKKTATSARKLPGTVRIPPALMEEFARDLRLVLDPDGPFPWGIWIDRKMLREDLANKIGKEWVIVAMPREMVR